MEQLQLPLNIPTVEPSHVAHDPYWDEITKIEPNTNNSPFAPEYSSTVGAQNSLVEHPCKSVGAQVNNDTQKTAPQHDTHWIEKYWVQRAGNKYWYYRYCWMVGRKKHRRYIGSVTSAAAKHKKMMVEEAIASDEPPEEIIKLIVSCRD